MVAQSTVPTGPRIIKLEQYSDFWCPWCYIGYREINAAVDRCKSERLPVEFVVEYKPFLLAPGIAEEYTVPRVEYFASRIGEDKTNMLLKLASDRCKTFGVSDAYVPVPLLLILRPASDLTQQEERPCVLDDACPPADAARLQTRRQSSAVPALPSPFCRIH